MKKSRKWLLGVALAVGITGFIFWAVLRSSRATDDSISLYETQPAARGYLAEIVGQTGSLRARQSARLTWLTSGKVGEVLVRQGDRVQAGDVLARLDPADLPVNILQAQSSLAAAERELANLQESQTARAQAAADLTAAQKEVSEAQAALAKLDLPNASPANIEIAQAAVNLAKAQLEQAEQFYAIFEAQPEDDVTRLQAAAQLEQARRALRNAEVNLTYAQSKPDAAAQARTQARLALSEAVLVDAQREWERVKDGPDADDLSAAQARIDAARATLATQLIIAPFSGTILAVPILPGDIVSPGSAAFDLFDLSTYYVDVPVPEVDITRVKTGQAASLTFDAIRERDYLGVVREVARTGNTTQGISNYTVVVEIVDPDEHLRPGLTAAVNITTRQAEDSLLVPNRAIRLIGEQRVVYVLKNSQPVRVPIEIGISDQVNTQLVSGELQSGDLIILNPGVILTSTP